MPFTPPPDHGVNRPANVEDAKQIAEHQKRQLEEEWRRREEALCARRSSKSSKNK